MNLVKVKSCLKKDTNTDPLPHKPIKRLKTAYTTDLSGHLQLDAITFKQLEPTDISIVNKILLKSEFCHSIKLIKCSRNKIILILQNNKNLIM